ncbi:MAG TPA: energy-coupling factor transporter transmembrane component T [Deltaproteobacteria bacterium]|nr:energy-coupling factor transporter transmembrane component T [Deltaproteobacteria bacterium]HOI08060.1 energy-coupling factor transporter transmembrane component T [Deltaproteobacteria bacterium]
MRVTLGQYLPGDSFVHRTDPRVKLFLMGLGIGTAFRMDSPVELAIFSLVCALLGLLSRVPFGRLLSGLRPFLWLFAFTALLHVFMTPGDPIAWVPNATWEGLEGGIRVGLQLVFAIWLSTLTTLTTSPLDMVWAMEWYMRPLKYLKVPVDEIALLIMLAIRFIPILFEETDRILKAQKARGVDIESGWIFRKVRSLVPILVPLLHGVFRRADDLAVALTLRGYSPGIERTKMKVMKAHGRDFLSLALAGSVFLALICF